MPIHSTIRELKAAKGDPQFSGTLVSQGGSQSKALIRAISKVARGDNRLVPKGGTSPSKMAVRLRLLALLEKGQYLLKVSPPKAHLIESFLRALRREHDLSTRYVYNLVDLKSKNFKHTFKNLSGIKSLCLSGNLSAKVAASLNQIVEVKDSKVLALRSETRDLAARLDFKIQKTYAYLAFNMVIYLDELATCSSRAYGEAVERTRLGRGSSTQDHGQHLAWSRTGNVLAGQTPSVQALRITLAETQELANLMAHFEVMVGPRNLSYAQFEATMMRELGDCLGHLPPSSPAELKRAMVNQIQQARFALTSI